MEFSYAKAGVDVKKVKGIQQKIGALLKGTHTPSVLMGAGHYAGLFKLGGKTLAIHTDGVGTKVLVAQMLGKYDTVGIDAIAMNVNDLVCLGAKPVAAVDYLAVEKTDEKMILGIMEGLAKGAKEAKCALIGGETAVVPDLIKGIGGRGFDLSVTCIGEVAGKPITGERMRAGDAIIGIGSSGLHSNGYNLARRVLLRGNNLKDRNLLLEMLKPTRIYSNLVLDVVKRIEVHGLAHITGGAFSKLQRIGAYAKVGFLLDGMPASLGIFKRIQQDGKLSHVEMYRTFNMGVGFCIICDKSDAEGVIGICRKNKMHAWRIGTVIKRQGVYLQKNGKKFDLS